MGRPCVPGGEGLRQRQYIRSAQFGRHKDRVRGVQHPCVYLRFAGLRRLHGADKYRPHRTDGVLFCQCDYCQRLYPHGKLLRCDGYLAVQHKRRFQLDAVLYGSGDKYRRGRFGFAAQHDLLGQSPGKKTLQPGIWIFRHSERQNPRRCGRQQLRHGDCRCRSCFSDNECDRV